VLALPEDFRLLGRLRGACAQSPYEPLHRHAHDHRNRDGRERAPQLGPRILGTPEERSHERRGHSRDRDPELPALSVQRDPDDGQEDERRVDRARTAAGVAEERHDAEECERRSRLGEARQPPPGHESDRGHDRAGDHDRVQDLLGARPLRLQGREREGGCDREQERRRAREETGSLESLHVHGSILRQVDRRGLAVS
jgi:hypothetical protein